LTGPLHLFNERFIRADERLTVVVEDVESAPDDDRQDAQREPEGYG
jgi:hypothetical protein